jgi:hypothetical protein
MPKAEVILKGCAIRALQYCGAATLTRPAPGHLLSLDDMAKLARRPLPPLELLDELFEIDETSPSGLRRKATRSVNARAGDIAGTYVPKTRYWVIVITHDGLKRSYYVHRLIYAMATRKNIDDIFIDHIEGQNKQNIVENLREATHKENMRNRGKSKAKRTSQYKCVYWNTRRQRWIAKMQAHGKYIWIGTYNSEIEAAKAYNEAAIRHHKDFASLNDIPA